MDPTTSAEKYYFYLADFSSYGEGLAFLNHLEEQALIICECFPVFSGSLLYFASAAKVELMEQYFFGEVDLKFIQILQGKRAAKLNRFCVVIESENVRDLAAAIKGLNHSGSEMVEIRFAKTRPFHYAIFTGENTTHVNKSSGAVDITVIETNKILKSFFD